MGGAIVQSSNVEVVKSVDVALNFIGEYRHSVDSKGRVAVPNAFRKRLSPESGGKFVLVRGKDNTIEVHPLSEWKPFANRTLLNLPLYQPAATKLRRYRLASATEVSLDVQGRILLPKHLRAEAGIGGDVVFAGAGSYFEMWEPGRYDAFLKVRPSPMTATWPSWKGKDGGVRRMESRPAVFHRPVMVDEVLEYLRPGTGTVIDATVGGGGHARAILDCLEQGRLLGLDVDPEAIASARRQLAYYDNVEIVRANYADMESIVARQPMSPVTGVLMDLGVSLHQLVTPGRGFGFDIDGPLDMRFQKSGRKPPALELIRRASRRQVLLWLREFGQEPLASRIARRIHERRHELRTTTDLARLVRGAVPTRVVRRTLARVFQAFRIATNRELEAVDQGLRAALRVLVPGGRLVVISYHSLEDRRAKVALRDAARKGRVRVLTPKPVRPGEAEVAGNPAARSARLRAAEVLA